MVEVKFPEPKFSCGKLAYHFQQHWKRVYICCGDETTCTNEECSVKKK